MSAPSPVDEAGCLGQQQQGSAVGAFWICPQCGEMNKSNDDGLDLCQRPLLCSVRRLFDSKGRPVFILQEQVLTTVSPPAAALVVMDKVTTTRNDRGSTTRSSIDGGDRSGSSSVGSAVHGIAPVAFPQRGVVPVHPTSNSNFISNSSSAPPSTVADMQTQLYQLQMQLQIVQMQAQLHQQQQQQQGQQGASVVYQQQQQQQQPEVQTITGMPSDIPCGSPAVVRWPPQPLGHSLNSATSSQIGGGQQPQNVSHKTSGPPSTASSSSTPRVSYQQQQPVTVRFDATQLIIPLQVPNKAPPNAVPTPSSPQTKAASSKSLAGGGVVGGHSSKSSNPSHPSTPHQFTHPGFPQQHQHQQAYLPRFLPPQRVSVPPSLTSVGQSPNNLGINSAGATLTAEQYAFLRERQTQLQQMQQHQQKQQPLK